MDTTIVHNDEICHRAGFVHNLPALLIDTSQQFNNYHTTTTVLWPFFGITQVSRCQKTSGLYGARKD